VDVGINREEKVTKDQTQTFYSAHIEDWGDLSIFYGYDELDLSGFVIKKSKIFDLPIQNLNELELNRLLKGGFGFVKIDSLSIKREFSSIPFNLILNNFEIDLEPRYNGHANFTIWKNNKLHYNVINGFIYDVKTDLELDNNGLIYK